MKLFTTDKILVELTEEELKILDMCLNSAYIRMSANGWSKSFLQDVDELWYQVRQIKNSLPF